MQEFQAAINTLNDNERPTILIANGFSQAWNPAIFNYANLFNQANFGDREAVMRRLFNNLETYDFEAISKQLTAAEIVLREYSPGSELINQLVADQEILKQALITAISDTHPNLPSEVTNEQYVSVRNFLSQFNKVFSVNYDLLFYWARNKSDIEPRGYRTDDGFRSERSWQGHGTTQDVFFLHGGLHIYDTGQLIKKQVHANNGVPIIEQVRANLQNGNFPLFVSEPTHQKKKQRIERNPYLSYCFRELGNISGSLFIHGHSMDENDKHLFDQIKSSQVTRIFVSIFGDENSATNTRTRANALAFLETANRTVSFYQAESAPVWRTL